jgi:integrase
MPALPRSALVPQSRFLIRKQLGKHPTYVFPWRGHKITQVNTKAWRQALERAGIDDFRWHDLRHTWASWHVQNGTPLNVLQELGAWESPEMVRRYAHFSADHLAPYAERLASLRVVDVGTDPTKIPTAAQ